MEYKWDKWIYKLDILNQVDTQLGCSKSEMSFTFNPG